MEGGSNQATSLLWIIGAAVVVAIAAAALFRLDRARRRSFYSTWAPFLTWQFFRWFVRFMHRPRFEGIDAALRGIGPEEPIIIVANHTGSIDPIILSCFFPRRINWLMLRAFAIGPVRVVAQLASVIFVDQDGRDLEGTRKALRVLKDGGVIGIFPEGGIARPPGVIRPFHSGVGMFARRSGATVLPVWVHGTPKVHHAMQSLIIPSRARLTFGEPMRFDRHDDVEAIAKRLRAVLRDMSGWPYAEEASGRAGGGES